MKYRICISALLLWAGMQLSASNNQEECLLDCCFLAGMKIFMV